LHEPIEILKKFWGYKSFRPPQLDIIKTILSQKDVLAILPTGSGKSVIYQVAGMALPGITIVVSPLIALIEDQVQQLQQKGIGAIALTGSLSFRELERLSDNAAYGNAKFLFLSPERLQNEYVQKRIAEMSVSLFTIDEAHCISEWGHDFRPQYLKTAVLRKIHPETPVLALTATAKQLVTDDIVKYMELKNPEIYHRSVFRENIAYEIHKVEDKLAAIELLVEKNETSIVYVRTRKQTYALADFLSKKGYTASFFHGGMTYDDKQKTLKEWLIDKKRMMFATNAFGMGIDKPDVRKVIHFDLPDSLENYVQESGRAGRDGNPAKAIILLADYDLKNFKDRAENGLANRADIEQIYRALYNHFYIAEGEGTDLEVSLNLMKFCKRFKLPIAKTYAVFQMFDREGIIELNQNVRHFSTVQILYQQENLRNYIANQSFGYRILDIFVRSYANIFHFPIKIDFQKTADLLSVSREELIDVLEKLAKREVISFRQGNDDLQIRFMLPRDRYIFQSKIKHFQKRIDIKKNQLKTVADYVQNKNLCRSQFLSRYFEEMPDTPCGICDICLQAPSLTDMELSDFILSELESGCFTQKELERKVGQQIKSVLSRLIENKKIFFDKNMKYCLK